MLGGPLSLTHPSFLLGWQRRTHSGAWAPQSLLAENSFLFSTLVSEPSAEGNSKLARAGQQGTGRVSVDLPALWSPSWSSPASTLQPTRLL